jgi:hypothetical protein
MIILTLHSTTNSSNNTAYKVLLDTSQDSWLEVYEKVERTMLVAAQYNSNSIDAASSDF